MCFRPNPFICHTSAKSARKSNHCHTSKKLLPQLLCLPHIRDPPGAYPLQTFATIFSHLATRHSPPSRNPFRMRSYKQTPCFARFWPKLSARNFFRMRSYANRRRNPFRMRTYKKSRGEGYVFPIFQFRFSRFHVRARSRSPDSTLVHRFPAQPRAGIPAFSELSAVNCRLSASLESCTETLPSSTSHQSRITSHRSCGIPQLLRSLS